MVPLDIAHAEDQIIIISPQDQVNTTIAYQDIFDSSEKIHSVHNLLEVNSGETKDYVEVSIFLAGDDSFNIWSDRLDFVWCMDAETTNLKQILMKNHLES